MRNLPRNLTFLAACLFLAACGQDPAAPPSANPAAPAAPAPGEIRGSAANADAAPLKATANGAAKCNIETLGGAGFEGGVPSIEHGVAVPVAGWYVDEAGKTTGPDLRLVIHNEDQSKTWSLLVPARSERTDVAQSLGGDQALLASGFAFDLDLGQFVPGNYGMFLMDKRGIESACGLGRVFVLK